jgi:amino acid transporter
MVKGVSVEFPQPGVRRRPVLTTGRVIVLVIAAAAPLAAMVGNTPLALASDAALAMPIAFLLMGAALLCFAAGYTALSKEIRSQGAFYTQVGQGLGRVAGVVAAYAAAFAYATYSIGMAAAFAYFTSLLAHELGLDISWMVFAGAGIAVVAVLGYRSLDLSAKLLIFFMLAEFAILLAFDACVLAARGWDALPLQVWQPASWATPGIGAVIPFVLVSFIGFEAAALYGEETRDPRRSIPRATFVALGVIILFYALSAWMIIGAAGADRVQALAVTESGNLVIALAQTYGGEALVALMGIFLVTSILASFLAIHNAASRYLYALAADSLLPEPLAAIHPDHHAPHVGSLTMSALEVALVFGLGALGAAPYVGIASGMIGIGTIGIIAMQIAAALAVVGYFRKARRGNVWRTRVLPLVGAAGLAVALVAIIASYGQLTGTDNPTVNRLPWIFVPLVAAALAWALYLKRHRPDAFARIASTSFRHSRARTAPKPAYQGRYCIVGAGPAGLIAARAFRAEGIPFDCFERHSDLGGLWDPDNPGTPIYDTAHFISSKWTSYFYGYPMPGDYPDYPSAAQILAYIRGFAEAFDLRRHISFNTEVTRAEPEGEGWRVTLSTGEVRRYAGIVCCPGVTWHPSMPVLPGQDRFAGEIRHSVTYRNPSEFQGKRVLIVGAGNSGVDIACDAARSADRAFLSVRRGYRFVPKHIFGIPTDVLMSGKATPPRGAAVTGDVNRMLDLLNGDLTRLGLPAPDHDALASHPIMNTQVLHHLAHGDLVAKSDVAGFEGDQVIFADGSRETVDLVLFCTGYDYRLPFLDPGLFEWRGGRPQLYLNILHRTQPGLYVLGFTEFADAAYRRFDDMAQVILADINARETGVMRAEMAALKAGDRPDLRGGKAYIDSPRHANYVEATTFAHILAGFRRRFGWPDLDDESFDALRATAGQG